MFVESLIHRWVEVTILACILWAQFYITGIIIASVRLISYKNIAQLHAALLAAYLLSIAPADLLLRAILTSAVFQFSLKFIGEMVGAVFILRKPMKLNENHAIVVLATVSLFCVGADVWLKGRYSRR